MVWLKSLQMTFSQAARFTLSLTKLSEFTTVEVLSPQMTDCFVQH